MVKWKLGEKNRWFTVCISSFILQQGECVSVDGLQPDEPFTVLEPQNPRIDEFHLVKDFKAPKLGKGSSNWAPSHKKLKA